MPDIKHVSARLAKLGTDSSKEPSEQAHGRKLHHQADPKVVFPLSHQTTTSLGSSFIRSA